MSPSKPTAMDILEGQNLEGKVAIVTGSNTGLGYELARALAKHHCRVVLGCRNEQTALSAMENIKLESPYAQLDFIHIALDRLVTVKEFADVFSKKYDRLDIVIFNAGFYGPEFEETEDGFELKFQVNFLANAYLTLLLQDKLIKGAPSRVILYSSFLQWFSSINPDNVNNEMTSIALAKTHHRYTSYGNSRRLASVFSRQIGKRWKKYNISSFTVFPGFVNTSHARHFASYFDWAIFTVIRPFGKTPEQGAGTIMYVAASPELSGQTGLDSREWTAIDHEAAVMDEELGAKVWATTKEILKKAGLEVPEEILD